MRTRLLIDEGVLVISIRSEYITGIGRDKGEMGIWDGGRE